MISNTWEDEATSGKAARTAADDRDPLLRPLWADTDDETDADLGSIRSFTPPRALPVHQLTGPVALALLSPLCDAQDALVRLDASVAVAPEAVRVGLVARMAFAEAAGWLAHAYKWIHPLDLALRDLGLTGSTALTATGSGRRVLPQTFASGHAEWGEQTFETMVTGDRAVAEALTLARRLRRMAIGRERAPFSSIAEAKAALDGFSSEPFDPVRFERWKAEYQPTLPTGKRRAVMARQGEPPPLPPLLLAARAAKAWMESGIADVPTPRQAVLAAVYLLAHCSGARSVFAPVWAAYPIIGYGTPDKLPALRSDVAARIGGREGGWMAAFLYLVAEGARAGLRELNRLLAVAKQARARVTKADRRSRLPDAVNAALRTPALTPKALAAQLRIAPQTATALLRELCAADLLREVTGRRSFRAFAL